MKMNRLQARLSEFVSKELLIESENKINADIFFKNGIMPGGEKWPGRIIAIVGYLNDPKFKNIKKKNVGDYIVFDFDMELKPGDGGGAGVTIDSSASNYYFSLAGTDASVIKTTSKSFLSFARSNMKSIGSQINKWFSDDKNWIWRLVGWENKDMWKKSDIKIMKIDLDNAIVDPTRRKWPSGRTEIWIPLNIKARVTLKKK